MARDFRYLRAISPAVEVDSPGLGLRRLQVGPPDSAGPGFRAIRVDN